MDYPILQSVEDGLVPDPKISMAIIAENDGDIVGRVFLVAPTHIEGIWVKPQLRGSTLGARMMEEAERQAKICGISRLIAYGTMDTEVYLHRLKFRREALTVWVKDL